MLLLFTSQSNEILVFDFSHLQQIFCHMRVNIGKWISFVNTVNRILHLTMKVAVNCILTFILSAFFLWQGWSTLCKYRSGKTTLQVHFYNSHHPVFFLWFCLFRLHTMMMEIFCFPLLLSVRTTFLQWMKKDFSICYSLTIYHHPILESCSIRKHGQEMKYSWWHLTTLWMKNTRYLVTQLEALKLVHLVLFHLCTLIVRKVLNQKSIYEFILQKALK